ncbi:conserved hypothetical protein [Catenulispora acidiphila DSM 44928]|uniref:Uncharacterized protein n=1 Tax=Catenulispora acidiphila (strain DSM 44928 / JCM 14897 / NBRC 102108 / NRRL B-24433 / ID139908) TaxID=479433 RepID=C7Q3G1_CATAD|nr:hypothetical protein [Catenulispora acidiphila]ACU75726.1 conserved hypothetical protein [Catenulispora acidiphila DSM 44928]
MTVFVTLLVGVLMMVIGLVTDGGGAVAARADALDEAMSAGRAASQAIDIEALHRDHVIVLDEPAARSAAADFMAATGDHAVISIRQVGAANRVTHVGGDAGPEVTVTVTRTVKTQFLWAVGIDSFAMTATATVTPEPGSLQ